MVTVGSNTEAINLIIQHTERPQDLLKRRKIKKEFLEDIDKEEEDSEEDEDEEDDQDDSRVAKLRALVEDINDASLLWKVVR